MLFMICWKEGEILKVYSESSNASEEGEIMCSPAIMLNEFHFIVFLITGGLNIVY